MSPKMKLAIVATATTILLIVVVVGLASLAPKTKPESVNRPPVPHFLYAVDNLTVTFNASASNDPDGSIIDYSWSFGDNGYGKGVEVVYTYLANGTYNVTLTVTDNGNIKNSTSKDVTVSLQVEPEKEHPKAVIEVVTIDNLTVTVSGANSKAPEGRSIMSFEWSFEDGGTATGMTVVHTFAANGTYTITLTVTDDKGDNDTASVEVTVSTGPSPPPPPPPPPVRQGPPGLLHAIEIHEGKASRNDGLQNSLDHLRVNLDKWLDKHMTP